MKPPVASFLIEFRAYYIHQGWFGFNPFVGLPNINEANFKVLVEESKKRITGAMNEGNLRAAVSKTL